jgi:hypothetical protein
LILLARLILVPRPRLSVGALGKRFSLGWRISFFENSVHAMVSIRCLPLLDMAPEHCPARRDGSHAALLDAAEVAGVRLSRRFAMAAEDVRHSLAS